MKASSSGRKKRSSRGISRREDSAVAHDWPAIAEVSRTVAIAPPPMLSVALPAPERRSADEGLSIDERLARLIGGHKRVLLSGDGLESVSTALVAAGCRVTTISELTPYRRVVPLRRRPATRSSYAIDRRPSRQRYDAVAVRGLLEYLDDPVAVLNGFRRQLAPDGYLVVVVPNLTHGSIRLRMLAGRAPTEWVVSGRAPARYYDVQSLKRLFEQAGFTIVRLERHLQPFDSGDVLRHLPLSSQLLSDLMRDVDALTAAFVVMAYAFPLNGRTSLEIRLRDVIDAQEQHRRAIEDIRNASSQPPQRQEIARLDEQVQALSSAVTDVKGTVTRWHEEAQQASQPALKASRDAIGARTNEIASIDRELQRIQYDQLVARVRGLIDRTLPSGVAVLVASKGDERLLELPRQTAGHFLQTTNGVYAGHHPASSQAAIDALEQLRAKGAAYLVFPATAFWWFDHYADFKRYLDHQHRVIARDERTAVIYELRKRRRAR